MVGGEISSWFTPTILFCILNVVIGAIFIASNLFKPRHTQHKLQEHHDQDYHNSPGQLVRAPSLLQRVKSINFPFQQDYDQFFQSDSTGTQHSNHQEQDDSPGQLARPTSLLQRVKSINFYSSQPEQPEQHSERVDSPGQLVRTPSLLDRLKSINFSQYLPDPLPTKTQQPDPEDDRVIPAKVSGLSAKLKEAAGRARAKMEDEEEINLRRPATMRERKVARFGEDEEVDAKADDFINRFKQQLKLQRLDSILRYKEMLTGGSAE